MSFKLLKICSIRLLALVIFLLVLIITTLSAKSNGFQKFDHPYLLENLTIVPVITHYSLDLKIYPADERFEAKVKVTVSNKTNQPHSQLPFLLYRLLDVERVTDEKNSSLNFQQKIVKFPDEGWNNLQVNVVNVRLKKPLRPQETKTIEISYKGSIYGYSEVMGYVKDKISEEYSLLRPDALAYPMLTPPTAKSLLNVYRSLFTYDINVTVPSDFIVACGGQLQNERTEGSSSIFIFKSKIPTWRMDIAVAKFKVLKDVEKKLLVYALPKDEEGAKNVLNASKKVISLYSDWFGEIENYQGYTIIEIPDEWGSQASDFYFLQTSAAFNDAKAIGEVYHEIAHSWNVKTDSEIQRTRFFDEAFASYFQAIAVREFEGEKAFEDLMNRYRESFIRNVGRDKINFETPISEYGKQELGRNSYTKGAWALYVLHTFLGEEQFKKVIRSFLSKFRDKPANFKDFQAVSQNISGRNLDKYFNEWIYGVESSRLLTEKVQISEMVKRY